MTSEGERFGDKSLQAAWQELAAEAARQAAQDRPWLLKLLARRGAPLAARYALWKGRLERLRPGQRRALQRRLGVSLAGAALLLALAASPGAAALGATITVDQTSGAIAVDGACSLPEAINNANGDSQYSAAAGECAAGSGADTIYLDTDVTLTASNNTTFGATGLPVITSAITIEGQGNTISRTSGTFRIMAVGSGANLTLNSATVSGGIASGVSPAYRGGGIYARSATLAITNSTLSGNSANYGGGIYTSYATVAVSNSTLSGNWAFSRGGGIYAFSSTAAVSNSTLSGNSTDAFGGGIYARFAAMTVSNSTLSGNWASARGGGIYAFYATVAASNSTFSGNSASLGGGIFAFYATVAVSNSTLSGNSASLGGGIYWLRGAVTASNSIIALQTAGADCSGALTSGGYNIDSDATCEFTGTGDQQGVSSGSLNLKPLANTGGSTQTHALGFGSVALDQIPFGTNGCGTDPTTDQRGISRPQDWGAVDVPQKCDVGAWEGNPTRMPMR